ncbi:jg19661 [Pararge aegeria aegeria]|uniref:Jg19661 protein n=1 Tax=Pararge aegeria aegeria TaxID=348720 RepID=A0A8S4QQR8_9NEOP|nr:jg19661 [Pararge aegeria aegeria]
MICKSMERVFNHRLLAYLEKNDLLSDQQYGFRRNRSTGDLLVYATHIWGEAIDKHDGSSSDQMAINAGVPQESVLSDTLFLLNINDLLKPGIFGYADDSNVAERLWRVECRASSCQYIVQPQLRTIHRIQAKTAGKKLGILNKVKRYFTPEELLTLYQAQVRSCMEYCSHLRHGSAKYQLDALDSVDRRSRRLIGDLDNNKLQSLEHRRKVACLSVFYRIYFGEYAQELFDLVPPSPFYHRTARHRKDLHTYVVDIPRTRT